MASTLQRAAASIEGSAPQTRVRFETMLEPVLPLAYRAARLLSRNHDSAQDLVQEASLHALRGYKTFEPGTNFTAWFLRILTNCFYAHYRKNRRQPQTIDIDDAPPLDLMSRRAGGATGEPHDDPAAALLGRMDSELVADAIATLPDNYRVVATLYFLDDLSYQEIADILSCPVGTVRSRLHRGRRAAQKALWRVAVDHGIVAAPLDDAAT